MNHIKRMIAVLLAVALMVPGVAVSAAETSSPTTGSKTFTAADVTVKSSTYNKKAQTPSVTVKVDGTTLKAGSEYTVAKKTYTKAGTYDVTIEGQGAFKGTTVTVKYTIKKAAAKLNTTSKTLKAKDVKKKKKTFTISVTTDGKKTFKVTKGSKYVSVNKTTGKVTVKKGAKKGTYKITVTAKAGKNYKELSKKTITVKVK
jgi:hypothetical protein